MRWLWLQKQLYQFLYRATRKKRIAMQAQEADAFQKAAFFKARMEREHLKHPALLRHIEDWEKEGEQWKDS